MIREPTVGMRVVVSNESCWLKGECGEIILQPESAMPRVRSDSGVEKWLYNEHLTEIKESNMYLDEAMKAVREDSNMEFSWCDKNSWYDWSDVEDGLPNISCVRYNDFAVRTKKKVIKEVTAEQMMRDLRDKYGCEVKVTE